MEFTMPTPHAPRGGRLSLTVSTPPEPTGEEASLPHVSVMPWVVSAVGWTLGALALGWLVVGALAAVGWLTAVRTPWTAVLQTTSQAWLAMHGAGATVGTLTLGITPLGLTGGLCLAVCVAAHHAARTLAAGQEAPRWRAWAAVIGTCAATYSLSVLVIAALVATPAAAAQAFVWALGLSLLGAAYGARSGLGFDPLAGAAGWVRRLPSVIGVGLVALAIGAFAALVTGLAAHWSRVMELQASLSPDGVGVVLLTLAQLAFLPNLVLWAGAYTLGAGFTLGTGTVFAPDAVTAGLLPAVPVFGAVPTAPDPWDWAWLAVGVLAGGVAGWRSVRACRLQEGTPALGPATWQAAVAGAGTALVWVALSWLSRGDLGAQHLVGLGPRFPALLWWTIPLLTGASALVGLVTAAVWGRRDRAAGLIVAGEVVPDELVASHARAALAPGSATAED